MTISEHLQLRAFARIDGAYLGILWTISFACYIMGMSQPTIGLIGTTTALASPLYAARRLWKFRDDVREGEISFRRSMAYYIFMFFYASILFALAQYAYFEFLDNGFIVRQYIGLLSSPEAQSMLKAYGLTAKEVMDNLNELSQTSAILIATNIMVMNLLIGVILSLPVAAATKRAKN